MVTNGNEICKKGVYLRKRESIENEKIIAIYYHIPVMIAIFCRLRGIGFFGQDEPNWIFLNLKSANFVFFELKKLLSKVPAGCTIFLSFLRIFELKIKYPYFFCHSSEFYQIHTFQTENATFLPHKNHLFCCTKKWIFFNSIFLFFRCRKIGILLLYLIANYLLPAF